MGKRVPHLGKELAEELANILMPISPEIGVGDCWVWKVDPTGSIFIKSAYNWVKSKFSVSQVQDERHQEIFKSLWKS